MNTRDYTEKDRSAVLNIFSLYWSDKVFLDELLKNMDERSMRFYIAEENEQVVGIAGFREAPEHLRAYAETKNPAELYVVASKLQNRGIGSLLVQKVIEEAKKLNVTEIECYSPETHSSSWKFYEGLGFTKHGIINDPDDGYPGMLWIKVIK